MRYLNYFGLLFLSISGLFFSSCDTIENPIPKVRPRSFIDTLALDSVEAKTSFGAPTQKVLLEDYTGHQCGNCPRAAAEAKRLRQLYGNKLVVMGIHVGYFARTNATGKFSYDFKSETGNDLDAYFKVSNVSLPQGLVNRIVPTDKSSPVVTDANWGGMVESLLKRTPKLDLQMVTYYKPITRVLNAKVKVKALQPLSGNYQIAVYLLEDSIVNWQKDYSILSSDKDIENYVHQHVLRTSLNGSWGDPLKVGAISAGETFANYYGMELNPAWKAKNISVVAYVYNKATNEIVQVEERHISAP